MNHAELTFESGEASLGVRRFRVEEALSGLFRADVTARSSNEGIELGAFVGRAASFAIQRGSSPSLDGPLVRRWTGICIHAEISRVEESETGLSTYEIVIVPALWLLTQRRNNRLFQHVSIPDIITRLLSEWNITPEWRIQRETYPALELRAQYDETDHAFFSRLLEEAGISFSFLDTSNDKTPRGTVLVLDDEPNIREEREGGPIPFVDETFQAAAGRVEFVTRVKIGEDVRPGRVAVRDFDFWNPKFDLTGVADAAQESGLEHYRYLPSTFLHEHGPSGARSAISSATRLAGAVSHFGGGAEIVASGLQALDVAEGTTPVADDRGVARFDQRHGASLAQRTLDALRAGKRRVSFETNCADLGAGRIFRIDSYPREDLESDRRLLVTRFSIEGEVSSPDPVVMRGTAHFADFPHRPEMVTPKPKIHGIQSAIVVGPLSALGAAGEIAGTTAQVAGALGRAAEGAVGAAVNRIAESAAGVANLANPEIYTDEFGRVRVQFHWDREGKHDENSSIWMRVSQGWAGGGYGLFTVPRVGNEVLVAFLDGDPDSPIIVGRAHNRLNTVPFKLPDNKTVSTWKTNSSPGGGGFNELRFDDASGREHVYIQAQKDMDTLVKNDQKEAVGHDRTRYVQRDEAIAIGHDRQKVVQHNETEVTGLNRSETVGLNRISTVGVEDSTLVGARWSVTVARGLAGRLSREIGRVVDGPLSGVLQSAANTVFGMIPNTPLGGAFTHAAQSTLAGLGAATRDNLKNVLSVLAGFQTEAGPAPTSIEVVDRRITFTTGEASIILDGPNVTIRAEGNIAFHALKSVSVVAEEEIAIGGREKVAIVSATDDVIVQAKENVHLNPYESGKAPPPAARLDADFPSPHEDRVCDLCKGPMIQREDGQWICLKTTQSGG